MNRKKNAFEKQRLFATIIKMPLFQTKNKGISFKKGKKSYKSKAFIEIQGRSP